MDTYLILLSGYTYNISLYHDNQRSTTWSQSEERRRYKELEELILIEDRRLAEKQFQEDFEESYRPVQLGSTRDYW